MQFAKLEAVANASVLNHLANVQVAIGGAVVPGIFRNPSSVAQVGSGAADTSPTLTVATSAVMAEPADKTIEIAGIPYVIGTSSPDGTGLTVLTVERAQ